MTAIDTRHGPAEPHAIRQWLTRLTLAVSNPPSKEDFAARMSMVLFVCADFPAGCWTDETLHKAVRTFKFWPSAAEVHDLLKPRADQLADMLHDAQLPRAREAAQLYAPVANPQEETLRSRAGHAWNGEPVPSRAQEPVRSVEEQLAILRGDRLALLKPDPTPIEEPSPLAETIGMIADRVRPVPA